MYSIDPQIKQARGETGPVSDSREDAHLALPHFLSGVFAIALESTLKHLQRRQPGVL